MTSSDGIEWTSRTSAADNSWYGVTYGNGLFVAVAYSGTGNRVMTSSDGIEWTSRTSAADNSWYGVTYGNGLFVAVAGTGTGNRVMTSPDGIEWTSKTSAADNSWSSVIYGNGLFVAVADSGIGNRVMTATTTTLSPTITNFTIPSKTYGDLPFLINPPTSNSDGPFTYSSSNPLVATIVDGSYINIVGAGTSNIIATQAATTNYTSGSIETPFVVNEDTPTNPVVVDNGDGLLYFMDTTSMYCKINDPIVIDTDLIAYSTKVLFANNPDVKIIKTNN